MSIAVVKFRKCLVNQVEYGSDERHVGSRVVFDLEIGGRRYVNLHTDIRQRIGPDAVPLEIGAPAGGYTGPFNLAVFHGCLEFYYRHVVGAHGLLSGGDASNLLLKGYPLELEMAVQFEIAEGSVGDSDS